MNRTWILVVVGAYPILAFAQTNSPGSSGPSVPYQPAVPSPTTINASGGWPGYGGGVDRGWIGHEWHGERD